MWNKVEDVPQVPDLSKDMGEGAGFGEREFSQG